MIPARVEKTPEEWVGWLRFSCNYPDAKIITGNRYAAIFPLIYTHAIISGRMGDDTGYDDRWCFHSYEDAKAAFDKWDGTGEPEGWHRHPASGRRRDAAGNEWINP